MRKRGSALTWVLAVIGVAVLLGIVFRHAIASKFSEVRTYGLSALFSSADPSGPVITAIAIPTPSTSSTPVATPIPTAVPRVADATPLPSIALIDNGEGTLPTSGPDEIAAGIVGAGSLLGAGAGLYLSRLRKRVQGVWNQIDVS